MLKKEVIKKNYLVDHLKQEFRSSNKTWKYPTKSDEDVVEKTNLKVGVKGEWSLVDLRNNKLCWKMQRRSVQCLTNSVIHIEKQHTVCYSYKLKTKC